MTTAPEYVPVSSEAELRDLLGYPSGRAVTKERARLHRRDREWLAASPFCLIATADADGNCDVSPKGDPPGFTYVVDDTTIAFPDRPGNRRADGFRNVLANPHVGTIFMVPGRSETLRINGRARLLRDAPFFGEMTVKGHRPRLRPGHRDRHDLLPLRQGVPPVGAVAAGDVAPGRSAAARRHREERPGHAGNPRGTAAPLRARVRGSPVLTVSSGCLR